MPASHGSLLRALDSLGLPHGLIRHRISLGPFVQTIFLAIMLLDSIGQKQICQKFPKRQGVSLRQYLPFVLNGYNRLRKLIVRWLQKATPTSIPTQEQVSLQFLESFNRLCELNAFVSPMLSHVSLSSTWIQCLGDFLPLVVAKPWPACQTRLSQFLNEWLQARQSRSSADPSGKTFLVILEGIKDSSPGISRTEPCLLVIISPSSSCFFII